MHNLVLRPQSVSLIQQKYSSEHCLKVLLSGSQVFQCSTEIYDCCVVVLIRNCSFFFFVLSLLPNRMTWLVHVFAVRLADTNPCLQNLLSVYGSWLV